MAANAQVYQTSTIVSATPTFNADVAIATIGPCAVDLFGGIVRLSGTVAFTTGADTTAVVLTLRRNSITGQIIGTAASFPVAAATAYVLNVAGSRNEPVGNHTYSIVITQTGASAAGTVGAVTLYGIVGN